VRDEGADEARRIEKARNIWCQTTALRGTLAEQYLRTRGIEVPDEALDVLGFHPRCPWGLSTVPALVAVVRDIFTGEEIGVHRTALSPEGDKLERPKMLGPVDGGAIKLSGASITGTKLIIGEGVETSMSAMMFVPQPWTVQATGDIWSVMDAGGISKFPVLPGIERLTILVDNDESGAGQRATAECKARWEAAGRIVETITPQTVGHDLNSAIDRRAGRC